MRREKKSLYITFSLRCFSPRPVRECQRCPVQYEGLFHLCCFIWEWKRSAVGHQTSGPLRAHVHCSHWSGLLLWLAPWWQVKAIFIYLLAMFWEITFGLTSIGGGWPLEGGTRWWKCGTWPRTEPRRSFVSRQSLLWQEWNGGLRGSFI